MRQSTPWKATQHSYYICTSRAVKHVPLNLSEWILKDREHIYSSSYFCLLFIISRWNQLTRHEHYTDLLYPECGMYTEIKHLQFITVFTEDLVDEMTLQGDCFLPK